MAYKTIKPKKKVKEEKVDVSADEEHEETVDEKKQHIKAGQDDEDIYSKEGRETLEEDDELEPGEEGFMEGASGLGQLGKDALTGEPLLGADDVIEMEIGHKVYRFVSRQNAEKFRKKKLKEVKK